MLNKCNEYQLTVTI